MFGFLRNDSSKTLVIVGGRDFLLVYAGKFGVIIEGFLEKVGIFIGF